MANVYFYFHTEVARHRPCFRLFSKLEPKTRWNNLNSFKMFATRLSTFSMLVTSILPNNITKFWMHVKSLQSLKVCLSPLPIIILLLCFSAAYIPLASQNGVAHHLFPGAYYLEKIDEMKRRSYGCIP